MHKKTPTTRPATAAQHYDVVHPKLLTLIEKASTRGLLPPVLRTKCKSTGDCGLWVCNGCGKVFQNNMQHWLHAVGPKHKRAWFCRIHNEFEVP